jgi:hypothetical protein
MTTTETNEQKLERIKASGFGKNDALVIMHFDACGIDAASIDPKRNVLTFNAWKGAGRVVAKGASGCPLTIWIAKRGKPAAADSASDKEKAAGGMYPKTSRVFHESQTIPADSKSIKVRKDGTVKEWPKTLAAIPTGWINPALFKDEERELYAQAVGRLTDGPPKAIDNLGPWTEETTLEQVDAEMQAVLTDQRQPQGPFSGPKVGDIVSEEVLTLDENGDLVPDGDVDGDDFGKAGKDRPAVCNCPMVGVVTNVDCPLHGNRVTVA